MILDTAATKQLKDFINKSAVFIASRCARCDSDNINCLYSENKSAYRYACGGCGKTTIPQETRLDAHLAWERANEN